MTRGVVNDRKLPTIFGNNSILDVWQSSEYASDDSDIKNNHSHKSLVLGVWMKQSEAVVRKCFVGKAFFKILQNLQENDCVSVSF